MQTSLQETIGFPTSKWSSVPPIQFSMLSYFYFIFLVLDIIENVKWNAMVTS